MNIGIVCYPTYGGSGVMATELGKSLALQGHQVHFITTNRPFRLDFSQNIYFHEVTVPNYPLFDTPPYESALASRMVDVAKYHHIDLFHVHYALPHASVAYLAKQILKTFGLNIPVVLTLHGTDITVVGKDKSYEPVVTFAINQSDVVTTVSEFLKTATYENFSLCRQTDLIVIPNFVNTERFKRNSKDYVKKVIANKGEKVIVHTSNFRKVKRVEDVILCFEKIQAAMPAKLLMVGDGPLRRVAEDLSRELNISEKVFFVGAQDSVEEIYSIGDLFLLLSETESFGLAALEAMACGVPVIASRVGGLPEVVEDGVSGYCCELGDIDCMADKAIALLQNPEMWEAFSTHARKAALRFSPENIVPLYEDLYKKVLSKEVVGN